MITKYNDSYSIRFQNRISGADLYPSDSLENKKEAVLNSMNLGSRLPATMLLVMLRTFNLFF